MDGGNARLTIITAGCGTKRRWHAERRARDGSETPTDSRERPAALGG
nr:MAG TPA: hypothetical protein [Caudoviricetes sp.]